MGNIFAASEIVELGIEIEKNGKDFYDTLSVKSKIKEVKEIFRYLSGEEEKHLAIFRKILGGIEKYEPAESFPGEYLAYMSSLAGEYVFTQKDKGVETAKNTKSDREAVELGIAFEKDSIVFYEGMKKAVPNYDQKIIDMLIAQEKEHLAKLSEIKDKV